MTSTPVASTEAAISARNRKRGLGLFMIYLALYTGFVILNTFRPDLCERPALGGVNVAVLYGFALILSAFVLAILYGWLCRSSSNGNKGGTP